MSYKLRTIKAVINKNATDLVSLDDFFNASGLSDRIDKSEILCGLKRKGIKIFVRKVEKPLSSDSYEIQELLSCDGRSKLQCNDFIIKESSYDDLRNSLSSYDPVHELAPLYYFLKNEYDNLVSSRDSFAEFNYWISRDELDILTIGSLAGWDVFDATGFCAGIDLRPFKYKADVIGGNFGDGNPPQFIQKDVSNYYRYFASHYEKGGIEVNVKKPPYHFMDLLLCKSFFVYPTIQDLIRNSFKEEKPEIQKLYPYLMAACDIKMNQVELAQSIEGSPLMKLVHAAYQKFWVQYDKTKLPKNDEIDSWIKNNWDKYSLEKYSKVIAENIRKIIRPPDVPNKSQSKNKKK